MKWMKLARTDTAASAAAVLRKRVANALRYPLVRLLLATMAVSLSLNFARIALRLLGLAPARDGASHRAAVMLLGTLFTIAVVHIVYLLYVRHVEHRAATELAAAHAARELAAGIFAGAGIFSLVMLVLVSGGWYRATGTNPWSGALAPLLAAAGAAYVEELVMRGILFRNLEALLGSWLALAGTALLFGLAHLANPNATVATAVALALEAGVLLGAAYMLTRRLWLAIGLHFAWNFVQGGVFGVAVSGIASEGILRAELRGPAALTGGEFGVEASVPAVIICLAAAAALLTIARRRGHVVAPAWRRPPSTDASIDDVCHAAASTSFNRASTAGGGENP